MNTTYNVTLFGLELEVDRVAFTLPIGEKGWSIYWYGIIIAVGFLLAMIYCFRKAKKWHIDLDRLIDVVLVTTPLSILGARLYYVLFDGKNIDTVKEFFSIHDGGLAIYGGIITAAVVGCVMCLIRKVKITDTLDLAALGFLIGQGIGRWGNFVNQEAFGRFIAADSFLPSWWGMTSEAVADYYMEGVRVHPCFLYESLWCLLGFVLLHILSKRRKFSGQIALCYGVWYGIGRFLIEGLRIDSLYIGNSEIRVSQAVSLAAVVICATLLIYILARKKYTGAPKDADYNEMFGEVENSEEDEYTPVFGDVFGEEENSAGELSAEISEGTDDLSDGAEEEFVDETLEEITGVIPEESFEDTEF